MDYRELANEILLRLLKTGDGRAFQEIYLRYWEGLYNTAFNKTNSREIAEDIVQSVFTDLWDRRERQQIQNLPAYLNTAVKYQVMKYIRTVVMKKSYLTVASGGQNSEECPADLVLLVQELRVAIDKAISQLPPKTQTIFRLSRFERHSNKDISIIMDLSEKSVEYHISQSLKTLRMHLKDFMLGMILLHIMMF